MPKKVNCLSAYGRREIKMQRKNSCKMRLGICISIAITSTIPSVIIGWYLCEYLGDHINTLVVHLWRSLSVICN